MSAAPSHRECDDHYHGVVAVLNDRWRVVTCRDGLQWIVQGLRKRRDERGWQGRSYCHTREGLHQACARLPGSIRANARAVLDRLPERIDPKVRPEAA